MAESLQQSMGEQDPSCDRAYWITIFGDILRELG
jgi:hypothetical protein